LSLQFRRICFALPVEGGACHANESFAHIKRYDAVTRIALLRFDNVHNFKDIPASLVLPEYLP